MTNLYQKYTSYSLVLRIIIGIILGIVAGSIANFAGFASIFGTLFVKALKAVAPILVFLLVCSSIMSHNTEGENKSSIKSVLFLYLLGTFAAAFIAVCINFLVDIKLSLNVDAANSSSPSDIFQVLKTLLSNMFDNPINAIISGNYIGILTWSVLLGLTLRTANNHLKHSFGDVSHAFVSIIGKIVQFAPFGVFGLVADTVATTGFSEMATYLKLVVVLVVCMVFVALVLNPLIVFWKIKANPYPLVLKCLTRSGITAFFTRSSAANIPVNLQLAEELGVDKETYSISIPLGATINMEGAAITITTFAIAAANTLGVAIDFPTAILLAFISAIGACGASGVPGGSLLLIPMGCSLFGINNDVAMQVVAIGFVVSVIQDSFETALNSSTDILFTAASDMANKQQIS